MNCSASTAYRFALSRAGKRDARVKPKIQEIQVNQLINIALQGVEEEHRAGAEDILRIMRTTFGAVQLDSDGERRRGVRYEMHQSAVIQIMCNDDTVVCLPAVIRNISLSGLLLEILDKGHVYSDMLDTIDHFSVLFILPGEDAPMVIDCHPKRMELRRHVRVGAEFSSCSEGLPLM